VLDFRFEFGKIAHGGKFGSVAVKIFWGTHNFGEFTTSEQSRGFTFDKGTKFERVIEVFGWCDEQMPVPQRAQSSLF